MKIMTRREFLRMGVGVAAVASGLQVFAGCATTDASKGQVMASPAAIKPKLVIYPPLPYNKIQPPQDGCLVGLYKMPAMAYYRVVQEKLIKIANKAHNVDEYVKMLKKEEGFFEGMKEKYRIDDTIAFYENAHGAKPFIFVPDSFAHLFSGFPMADASVVARSGMVPFVFGGISAHPKLIPARLGLGEIARCQYDGYIKEFAQGAIKFGKEHGGFFCTTMIELNANWWYWGQKLDLIPAWRRIWQIFEDQGANQYVTWVWVIYNPYGMPKYVDDPERYYPGDGYVDWIGINTFSNDTNPYTPAQNAPLDQLIDKICGQLHKKHPEKPIMLSMFGRAIGPDQPRWLIDAYRSIRNDFPEVKTAVHFDLNQKVVNQYWTDSTLTPESVQTLKEIFKDPYWIMARMQKGNAEGLTLT
jgi:hypothetical protein